MGKQWKQCQTLFSWAPKSLQMVTAAMKIKDACSLEENLWPSRQPIKKQRHYFANTGLSSQSYDFPVVKYWCKCWTIKKAECWRIDAFEIWCWRRVLRIPWTAWKSSQSVNPKGNQPWVFIERWSSNTLATWCEEPTHWKRPWCWERLKTKGERDCREGDG